MLCYVPAVVTRRRLRLVAVGVALGALAGCTAPSATGPGGTGAEGASPPAGDLSVGDVPLAADIAPAALCEAYRAADLADLTASSPGEPTMGTGRGTVASGEPWGYCQAAAEGGALSGIGVYPAAAVEAIGGEPYCTSATDVTVDGLPGVTCVVSDDASYQLLVAVQVTRETALVLQTLDLAGPQAATPEQAQEALGRFIRVLAEQLDG